MNTSEAITLLKNHAVWLKDSYSSSPEGQRYYDGFKEAIMVLDAATNFPIPCPSLEERWNAASKCQPPTN